VQRDLLIMRPIRLNRDNVDDADEDLDDANEAHMENLNDV
jgi:hypothetical protein